MQEMLEAFEEFAKQHNLQFSTDENPVKSKTKCLAFLNNPRNVPKIILNGNDLSWVKSGIHLSCNVQYQMDGMKQDTRVKEQCTSRKT